MTTFNLFDNASGLSNITNRQYYNTIDIQFLKVGWHEVTPGSFVYTYQGLEDGNIWQTFNIITRNDEFGNILELNPSILDYADPDIHNFLLTLSPSDPLRRFATPLNFQASGVSYNRYTPSNVEEIWVDSTHISGTKCFAHSYGYKFDSDTIDYLYEKLKPTIVGTAHAKAAYIPDGFTVKYPWFNWTPGWSGPDGIEIGDVLEVNVGDFNIPIGPMGIGFTSEMAGTRHSLGANFDSKETFVSGLFGDPFNPFQTFRLYQPTDGFYGGNLSWVFASPFDLSDFPLDKYPVATGQFTNPAINYQPFLDYWGKQYGTIDIPHPRMTGESYNVYVPSWYGNMYNPIVDQESARFDRGDGLKYPFTPTDVLSYKLHSGSGVYPYTMSFSPVRLSGLNPYFAKENNLINMYFGKAGNSFNAGTYVNGTTYFAYSNFDNSINGGGNQNCYSYQSQNDLKFQYVEPANGVYSDTYKNTNFRQYLSGVIENVRNPITNEQLLKPTVSSVFITYGLLYPFKWGEAIGGIFRSRLKDTLHPVSGIFLGSGYYSNANTQLYSIYQKNPFPYNVTEIVYGAGDPKVVDGTFIWISGSNQYFGNPKFSSNALYSDSPIGNLTNLFNIYTAQGFYSYVDNNFYGVAQPNKQDWRDSVLFSCPHNTIAPNSFINGSWTNPRQYTWSLSYGLNNESNSWYRITDFSSSSDPAFFTNDPCIITGWESSPTSPDMEVPPYIKLRSNVLPDDFQVINVLRSSGNPMFSLSIEQTYNQYVTDGSPVIQRYNRATLA